MGCASTPESRLRGEWEQFFWLTARKCLGLTTDFEIDKVEADGRLYLEVHHIATALDGFRTCYWKGVDVELERRRSAGLPVPDRVHPQPKIETEIADD